jgi:hypothetical protein
MSLNQFLFLFCFQEKGLRRFKNFVSEKKDKDDLRRNFSFPSLKPEIKETENEFEEKNENIKYFKNIRLIFFLVGNKIIHMTICFH